MTEEQKRFILASIRERLAFKHLVENNRYITVHEITPEDGYDEYDAIASFEDIPYLIELKVRLKPSTYGSYVIEKHKYDYLMSESKKRGIRPMYINFFNDDKVVIWDLSQLEEPDWKMITKPSNSQSHNAKLIQSEEADLSTSDGYIYTLPNINLTLKYEEAKIIFNLKYKN
jgi:hypothetical protein